MSSASRVKLTYVKESTAGTTPSTPTMKSVPFNTGDAFTNPRDTLQSAQVQSTRAPRSVRLGVNQPGKSLVGELQWISFDELISGAFGDTWEGGETISDTVTVAATTITLDSGNWSDYYPDVAVGNYIVYNDNGSWVVLYISNVTNAILTLKEADGSSDPTLTVASSASKTIYVGCCGGQLSCTATDTLVFSNSASTAVLASGHTSDWSALGFKEGDNIFFDGTSSNDGWNKISAISSDGQTLTLVTAPTDETINTTTSVDVATDAGRIYNGNNIKSYTFEEQFLDHATYKYRTSTGVKSSQIQFAIQPNSMVLLTLELFGMSIVDLASSSVASSEVDFTEREAFDSFTGSIKKDGSSVNIAGINFTIENALNRNFNLFSRNATEITDGIPTLSGDMNLYFEDEVMASAFFNETTMLLYLRMVDPDGNAYALEMPSVKLVGDTISIGDIDVTQAVPFNCVPDSSYAYEVMLRRQPVAH